VPYTVSTGNVKIDAEAELAIIVVSIQRGPVVLLVVAIHTKVLYQGAVPRYC